MRFAYSACRQASYTCVPYAYDMYVYIHILELLDGLLGLLVVSSPSHQLFALQSLMTFVASEGASWSGTRDSLYTGVLGCDTTFERILIQLLRSPDTANLSRAQFVQQYAMQYADVRGACYKLMRYKQQTHACTKLQIHELMK